jgi:hypothetical protein
MYKLLDQIRFEGFVKRIDSETVITLVPITDPDNTEAKQFAKWLSEGGIPESAVEGETVSAEWIAETIAKLS